MDHEQSEDQPRATQRARRDDETVHGSSGSFYFWALLVLLICLGLCVLISLILAIFYGS